MNVCVRKELGAARTEQPWSAARVNGWHAPEPMIRVSGRTPVHFTVMQRSSIAGDAGGGVNSTRPGLSGRVNVSLRAWRVWFSSGSHQRLQPRTAASLSSSHFSGCRNIRALVSRSRLSFICCGPFTERRINLSDSLSTPSHRYGDVSHPYIHLFRSLCMCIPFNRRCLERALTMHRFRFIESLCCQFPFIVSRVGIPTQGGRPVSPVVIIGSSDYHPFISSSVPAAIASRSPPALLSTAHAHQWLVRNDRDAKPREYGRDHTCDK